MSKSFAATLKMTLQGTFDNVLDLDTVRDAL
jgi:hypothetical protein